MTTLNPTAPVALAECPAAYRTKPGPHALAWMRRKGWLDRRTVTRLPASGVTREEKCG